MKKIIATVLAMVMALALCTTAFAGPSLTSMVTVTASYNKAGNEITAGTVYGYVPRLLQQLPLSPRLLALVTWLTTRCTPWLMMLLPNTAPMSRLTRPTLI